MIAFDALQTEFTRVALDVQTLLDLQRVVLLRDNEGTVSFVCVTGERSANVAEVRESILGLLPEAKPWLGAVWVYTAESWTEACSSEGSFEHFVANLIAGERADAKVYWFERALHLTTWDKTLVERTKTPLVTFYSFKGGVGRTTALAFVAHALTKNGWRVLALDADLEAPGLSYHFYDKDQVETTRGVLDFILEHRRLRLGVPEYGSHIEEYILQDQFRHANLYVIPAGRGTVAQYRDKLARVDFSVKDTDQSLVELLRRAEDHLKPDIILVDARTGITDVGGTLVRGLSDYVVAMGYPDAQTESGLSYVFSRAPRPQGKSEDGDLVPRVMVVHSPAEERRGSVDSGEHEYFKLMVRNALRKAFADEYFSEGYFNALDISGGFAYILHKPDLRGQIRQLGIEQVWRDRLNVEERRGYVSVIEQLRVQLGDLRREAQTEPKHAGSTSQNQAPDPMVDLFAKTFHELKSDPISTGGKASDEEFKSLNLIQKNFLPREQYRFLFKPDQFLILGEKGTGKTAIQKVLRQPQYAEALAKYLDVSYPQGRSHWITALDETKTPGSAVFQELFSTWKDRGLSWFWAAWTLWLLETDEGLASLRSNLGVTPIKTEGDFSTAVEAAAATDIMGRIDAWNSLLKAENITLYLTFDNLDAAFSAATRAQMNSHLIAHWLEWFRPFPNIRAKIFLRRDLFEREIDIENKGHLSAHRVDLSWSFEEIIRTLLKRAVARSAAFRQLLSLHGIQPLMVDGIGWDYPSELETLVIGCKLLFGEKITSASSYRWLWNSLRDGRHNVIPRSLLFLVHLLIQEQRQVPADKVLNSWPLVKRTFVEVSKERLDDMKQQHPDLRDVLNRLESEPSDSVRAALINAKAFRAFLERWGHDEPDQIIQRLLNVGILEQWGISEYATLGFPEIYRVGLKVRKPNGIPV